MVCLLSLGLALVQSFLATHPPQTHVSFIEWKHLKFHCMLEVYNLFYDYKRLPKYKKLIHIL